jgi:hypothetical protein
LIETRGGIEQNGTQFIIIVNRIEEFPDMSRLQPVMARSSPH